MLSIWASELSAELRELTAKRFEEAGEQQGIVVLQVNWGRDWGCGGFENAQLQKLKFARLPDAASSEPATLSLQTPSRLFVKDTFVPYAILVEPGEYALSKFDVKLARSVSDVGHLIGSEAQLFEEGRPVGGTFSVAGGEIVYIGHFGLDCAEDPIPWRYYVEGHEEFRRYVEAFRERYPYIKDKPVRYGLFSTQMFGEEYSLDG
jgi:hypothetical protein